MEGVVGMQNESEYAELKEFLSFYAERYLNMKGLPADKHPIASLESLANRSLRMALDGLHQAINDCVEMSLHFDHEEVDEFDAQLRSRGIVTLSELRRRYSRSYAKILRRGQIRSETEYHLARSVLNDPTEKTPEEIKLLNELISNYEGTSPV